MIPVFDPAIGEEEINAVMACLKRGDISGSFGASISLFEQKFAEYLGCKYAIAVNSGTAALHVAMSALEIKPGDEVLMSSSTNIATALAAYHHGAISVPIDSENITWNIDLDLVEKQITSKTKAIIPVHHLGHPVDMDRLMQIAKKHNIAVVEDCAESHGATVRGRMTGTFGDMGCYSFYANKVITTGEGGMVTTNNQALAERVRLLRNLAFTEPRFRHEFAGYNFRMPAPLAAIGVAQVEKIEKIISEKRRVAQTYNEYLSGIKGLQLPIELEWARNVYWMYGVVINPDFGISRNELIVALKQAGIDTRTFFCPMNQQPVLMKQDGHRDVLCPVADMLWERGVQLPSGTSLRESEIEFIADTVKKISMSK